MDSATVSRFFYFFAVWCNAGHFFIPKVGPVLRPRAIPDERQCDTNQQAA